MASSRTEKTRRMVVLSILTALVVVLQLVASNIMIGTFPLTLTLVPVVIGSALCGPKAGAWLGSVFGVVVLIMCVIGVDAGGSVLWNANPFLTAVICIGKGALAGFCAGLAYKAVAKKNSLGGVITAAVVSPVVNTGTFIIGLTVLFNPILVSWAGDAGSDVITYILVVLVGVNFLLELTINLVLSTVIERIINYRVRRLA